MKRLACLGLGLLALGCSPAVDVGEDTDAGDESTSTSSDTAPGTATTPGTTTVPVTTTTDGTTSAGTTIPTATDPTIDPASSSGFGDSSSGPMPTTDPGSSSGSSSTGGSGATDGDPGLPDGSQCTQGDECASGECYVAGALGGVCGECSSDADCDFGCNAPNPLANPPEGSTCSAGNLGENCENDDACVGLSCVSVIDIPGIVDVSSCSECAIDADCMPGTVCDIDLSIADFDGVWTCTPTGTEPIGASCALDGSGDDACGSGHCAAADLMGLYELGICSECEVNADCMAGQTCLAPDVGLDGSVTAGFCM